MVQGLTELLYRTLFHVYCGAYAWSLSLLSYIWHEICCFSAASWIPFSLNTGNHQFSFRISPATCYIISKYFLRSFPSLNTYTNWSMCSSILMKNKPFIKPKPYEHKLSLSPRILKIWISYAMVACVYLFQHTLTTFEL